ncbi:hypothetical protein [Geomonas azotofigens]|uniref:hypothetical protein n=1 Tax=Geomonas azotofigens TaxID=2843196 RepID=UPI001C0FAD1A|nr:hypothetical protein [Geomonas azotofigens]MBU5612177.1 hypothetical protein [Geomonas azotofigens]
MNIYFRYIVGMILGFLFALLIIPVHANYDISLTEFIKIAISAFSGIALAVAVLTYLHNVTKFNLENHDKKSDKYLNEAVGALERAFLIFTDANTNTSPPRPDRLNWLTTARIIESYKSLKQKVTSLEHNVVLKEHEEYWRHKFYTALGSDEMLAPGYFAKPKEKQCFDTDFENLDLTSLAVVYNFAEWKHNYQDPLDSVDAAKMLAYGTILGRHHGLMAYVKQFKKMSEEIHNHKINDKVVDGNIVKKS